MAEDYATTTTTPKSRGTSAGASSPDEELKKLKAAMEKDQTDADNLKKQMAERKVKIDGLEKALTATSQVGAAFAAALQGVTADRLEIQDFLQNELPQLENQPDVKSKKGEIETIAKAAAAKIEAKETERATLEQKQKDERDALQTANDDLATKKAELDDLQALQRKVQEKFTLLRKLSQRMKTEGATKPLVKYALAIELKKVWDDTKPLLITKEALQTSFYAKAEEVRAATAVATTQEEKAKQAQGAYETASKDLDALKAGRLDDIIKQVAAIPAPAPAAMAAGAGGAAVATAT